MTLSLPPCELHPDGRPVAKCPVCGKTVCSECIHSHGYFCSEECRAAYEEEQSGSGEAEYQDWAEAEAFGRRFGAFFKRGALVLVVLAIGYAAMRIGDRSGTQRWRVASPDGSPVEHLVHCDEALLALSGEGLLQAFNPKNGRELWRRDLENQNSYSTALESSGDTVYVAGYSGMLSLNAANGESRWENDLAVYGRHYWNLWGDKILLSCREEVPVAEIPKETGQDEIGETFRSRVVLLDRESGEIVWERDFGAESVERVLLSDAFAFALSHEFAESEFVRCSAHRDEPADSYFECEECGYETTKPAVFQLDALDLATGDQDWGIRIETSDVLDLWWVDDQVIAATARGAYGFDREGEERWSHAWSGAPEAIECTRAEILAGIEGGALECVDLRTGSLRWTSTGQDWVTSLTPGRKVIYAEVEGWHEDGSSRGESANPLDVLPDTAEKQMLEEVFGFDEDEDLAPAFEGPPRLVAYDLRTGKVRWAQKIIGGEVFGFDGRCFVSASSNLGAIFGSGDTSVLYACDPSDGSMLWRHKHSTAIGAFVFDNKNVYFIETVQPGQTLNTFASAPEARTAVCAVRRRGLLNRMTRW